MTEPARPTGYDAELRRHTEASAAAAVGRLRETLAAHLSDEGVRFDSRAWLVTARRS